MASLSVKTSQKNKLVCELQNFTCITGLLATTLKGIWYKTCLILLDQEEYNSQLKKQFLKFVSPNLHAPCLGSPSAWQSYCHKARRVDCMQPTVPLSSVPAALSRMSHTLGSRLPPPNANTNGASGQQPTQWSSPCTGSQTIMRTEQPNRTLEREENGLLRLKGTPSRSTSWHKK